MKLIGFIGTGDYREVEYNLENKSVKSRFAPIAIAKLIEADKIILFFTKESYDKYFEDVAKEGEVIIPVKIPAGKTEEERWEIFDNVLNYVNEDEEVAFDITHSFRFVPFVAFLAIVFMKEIKRVKLKGVYYGAFEASEEVEGRKITPVFNLSEAFYILDWYLAVSDFIHYGRLHKLSKVIENSVVPIFRSQLGKGPQILGSFKSRVLKIDDAVQCLNVPALYDEDEKTLDFINKNYEQLSVEMGTYSRPLRYVFEKLRKEIEDMGVKNSSEEQLKIVKWLLDKNDIYRGVILMREWMVNWFLMEVLKIQNFNKVVERKEREKVEKFFNSLENVMRENKDELDKEVRELIVLWGSLRQLRNTLAHCGFSESHPTPQTVIKDAKEYYKKLEDMQKDYADEKIWKLKKIYEEWCEENKDRLYS